MKVLFCRETLDITYLVSAEEAASKRRTPEGTPVLTAEVGTGNDELVFHLMNTRSETYIGVREPRGDWNHYWVTLSDAAWHQLERDGHCGTRYKSSSLYGSSSKVNVCINDELL